MSTSSFSFAKSPHCSAAPATGRRCPDTGISSGAPLPPAAFRVPQASPMLGSTSRAALRSVAREGAIMARRMRNVAMSALDDGGSGSASNYPEYPAGDSYLEATVDRVGMTEKGIPVMFLKMPNENLVLPILIGEAESTALANELRNKHAPRPMTHDLFKDSISALGAKVSRVFITDLVNNTYRATLMCLNANGDEVVMDARPSDAINLAVRFGSPIFVSREVAGESAYDLKDHPFVEAGTSPGAPNDQRGEENELVYTSVRDAFVTYRDPTTELRARMEIAAAEERYDDAARLRDEIERVRARDRTTTLVVAMQKAVEDGRFAEAKVLVEEFNKLQRIKLEVEAKGQQRIRAEEFQVDLEGGSE